MTLSRSGWKPTDSSLQILSLSATSWPSSSPKLVLNSSDLIRLVISPRSSGALSNSGGSSDRLETNFKKDMLLCYDFNDFQCLGLVHFSAYLEYMNSQSYLLLPSFCDFMNRLTNIVWEYWWCWRSKSRGTGWRNWQSTETGTSNTKN